ncbi:hypothetical protein Ciccas_000385 [Cichlidogyrus casuarinus]|uniref:C2 domain-containing protein n=1 Tax=Cichlidogyrus casuarinus TaxID=1844966 RepID=A0ABD2QN28_9PLAT
MRATQDLNPVLRNEVTREAMDIDNVSSIADVSVRLSRKEENLKELPLDFYGPARDKDFVGDVQYAISYDFGKEELSISLVQASELKACDIGGLSDPYAKVYVLPDLKNKKQTKVVKKNLNPVWNESFQFKVPCTKFGDHTLVIEVFDYDMFGTHDMIGALHLPLDKMDLSSRIEATKNLRLPDEADLDSGFGEIFINTTYLIREEILRIKLIECRKLRRMDDTGFSDPYVQIGLYKKGKRVLKYKTSVHKATVDPYFNETFDLKLPRPQVVSASVLVTVKDHDRFGSCDVIGRIKLAKDVVGTGLKQWMQTFEKPNIPCTIGHVLEDPALFK